MIISSNLGFPRIGLHRELKKALESYWAGQIDEATLQEKAREIRRQSWQWQQEAGIQHIPSNDFSLYDHVLDTSVMVGAIPPRFEWKGRFVPLQTYFAMARGDAQRNIPALEMTKWFDTNYHYLVPEFYEGQTFRLSATKPFDEFAEAKKLGILTRPVLLGPVSYLLLGKPQEPGMENLALLDRLLPVYAEVLDGLAYLGAEWIQLDEPCLATDLSPSAQHAFRQAYAYLSTISTKLKLLVANYFGPLRDNLETVLGLPVQGIHVDLVRGLEDLDLLLAKLPKDRWLSVGLVDGRNVWRNDFEKSLELLCRVVRTVGESRTMVGPSCSLLHVPVDLELEQSLDGRIRPWLAFAKQKLTEITTLARAASGMDDGELEALRNRNRAVVHDRTNSAFCYHAEVRRRLEAIGPEMTRRKSEFSYRRRVQGEMLCLPLLPTTTIGSFPQTAEIRKARARYKRGEWTAQEYEQCLKKTLADTIRIQEEIGLDVLVHGEAERNDMVEYFAEQMEGFAITEHGWVQSYGSRCVKPPILYGDVSRKGPMTVSWIREAMACTQKPVKGMLTGPITILCWSFVREDQPRSETCRQIALAIREEVHDLEAAGVRIIQIDEPALREGLPLRHAERAEYLRWAVECFRLASCGVSDTTQIHTHMCYSEFQDIIDAILALDADVISIEAARSHMELLSAFRDCRYPNDIGPGVYDIHSPRIPSVEDIQNLLRKALEVFQPEQLWVNPDCGLKTRSWEEVRPSLENMTAAARAIRTELAAARHSQHATEPQKCK